MPSIFHGLSRMLTHYYVWIIYWIINSRPCIFCGEFLVVPLWSKTINCECVSAHARHGEWEYKNAECQMKMPSFIFIWAQQNTRIGANESRNSSPPPTETKMNTMQASKRQPTTTSDKKSQRTNAERQIAHWTTQSAFAYIKEIYFDEFLSCFFRLGFYARLFDTISIVLSYVCACVLNVNAVVRLSVSGIYFEFRCDQNLWHLCRTEYLLYQRQVARGERSQTEREREREINHDIGQKASGMLLYDTVEYIPIINMWIM